MCPVRETVTAKAAELPYTEDVRRAILRLTSLHSGDIGVIETVACGKRAVPALRQVLFAREPSGLYETRRRAVEALAALHAHDVLIDFLRTRGTVADPVERTGEEAVINAAARALAISGDGRVVPLLLEFTGHPPLAGIVEALGRLRRAEALPYLVKALAEDFTRRAAEAAIRNLGREARAALLDAAMPERCPDGPETVSRKRQRRSALGLFAELGAPGREDWPKLLALMRDDDPQVSVTACGICLADAGEPGKPAAVARLLDLLPAADWLLSAQIEDCLSAHFEKASAAIAELLRRGDQDADSASPRARMARALRRVVMRAATVARRTEG